MTTTLQMADFLPLLPEILFLGFACTILLVDLFLAEDLRWITFGLALLALVAAAAATVGVHGAGVWLNGTYVVDGVSRLLKLFVYGSVATVLVYSREYLKGSGLYRGEFYALVAFATLGMTIMISAAHFLTLYLGLELLSLCLYALVAMERERVQGIEAAMKYFVLGALASGLLLYGLSMLYGATGTLELARLGELLPARLGHDAVLTFGMVFVVAALAFKLGAVPFHMWVPDVYQGSPSAVTLFIATAPKFAAFAFVLRLLFDGLGGLIDDWRGMLVLLAVLSILLGNVIAIAQTNLKRMLAYSTIAHMGFLLLGFLSGALDAALFYVVAYVLMSLAGFGMILLLSRKGFEAERLEDYKGLNQRSPWYAFLMLLAMFSMAGVPPTIGFYAKLSVLKAALDAGYVALVVFAVLMSVVGAFYYLRVVKLMYFDEPAETAAIQASADHRLLLSANGLGLLLLGVVPGPLMSWCARALQ